MSIIKYTGQDEYDVVHESQDLRGRTVTDQGGTTIGKVTDMLVDTDRMRVDSIVIDGKARVAAEDIVLRDERVIARGIHDRETYAQTNNAATAATGAAGAATYAAMHDQSQYRQAGHVSGVTRPPVDQNEITIPIIEEELVVGKRTAETGEVRVRTHIEERPVEEHVRLREEHVHVERHPVNRPVSSHDLDNFKEGEIDVTTHAEQAVVAKQARVVEEIEIGKEVTEREETIRDTVKRTEVDIDETGSDTTTNRKGNG